MQVERSGEHRRHVSGLLPVSDTMFSATTIADRLNVDFALINRQRHKGDHPDTPGRMELLVGDVKDKIAILIDDMADTLETLKAACSILLGAGAKKVYAIVTHGLLSDDAIEKVTEMPIEKLVVTNTICQNNKLKEANGKLEIMDISSLLAESIRRVSYIMSSTDVLAHAHA